MAFSLIIESTDNRKQNNSKHRWRITALPVSAFVCLALLLPLIALITIAVSGDIDNLKHLASTVMPKATRTTLLLMLGVGIFTSAVGFLTAWVIAFYDFPGRKIFEWALMLPLAVPTYISAYAFVEFFSFTGPIQTGVRGLGGFSSSRDYWFPEIRSLTGTVLVLGVVLYPYVYLSVLSLFRFQGNTIPDSARTLGAGPLKTLAKITLPLARPAIILGVALALMETINDIGAVEHLGTNTLTFSIFSVWLNQGDLPGAAQIALLLLMIVLVLIFVERWSRGRRRFEDLRGITSRKNIDRKTLTGGYTISAFVGCLVPIAMGFGIPVFILGDYAIVRMEEFIDPVLLSAAFSSICFALIASVLATLCGLVLAYSLRMRPSMQNGFFVRLASSGYAIPGTLLALGIFIPLAALDNFIDGLARSWLGFATGLLLTGSGFAMVYAYLVRFMAMAEGTLDVGLKKISANIDMAARSLGRSKHQTLYTVLLPVLRPAILTSLLLVFVEVIKELSATIVLRPFGVNTLATHVYDFASRSLIEEAAPACLLIILAGMVPVAILLKASQR